MEGTEEVEGNSWGDGGRGLWDPGSVRLVTSPSVMETQTGLKRPPPFFLYIFSFCLLSDLL